MTDNKTLVLDVECPACGCKFNLVKQGNIDKYTIEKKSKSVFLHPF